MMTMLMKLMRWCQICCEWDLYRTSEDYEVVPQPFAGLVYVVVCYPVV